MSEGAENTKRRTESIENSEDAAECRDILVEPIDFGTIRSISDRRAFYSLLLTQRRIVVAVKEPRERRREAAKLARGLYRLRINYLSTKDDFDGVQETVEHHDKWSHHIEHILQVPGYTRDFNLLRVSREEISELEDLAEEIRACELMGAEAKVFVHGPRIIKFQEYVRQGRTPDWEYKAALHGLLLDLDREYPPSPFAE